MQRSHGFRYFGIYFLLCYLTVMVNSVQYCSPPDVPVNGKYRPDNKSFRAGDIVTYSCERNSTLLGKEIRKCMANGSWSDTTPFCDTPDELKNPCLINKPTKSVSEVIDGQIDTCFSLQINTGESLKVFLEKKGLVNAVKMYIGGGSINIEVLTGIDQDEKKCALYKDYIGKRQWILIKCANTRLISNSIRITGTSGTPKNISICEIQAYVQDEYDCENPPEMIVSQGYFKVSRTKATLICDSGYQSQNDRLVCEANVWKSPGNIVPRCDEILCDPIIPNTTLQPGNEWAFLDMVNKLSAGTRRQLKCGPGYRLTGGPDKVTCQKNGKWTETNAVCVEDKPETSTRTIVTAAVAVVAVIVILILLGITIYLIKKQRDREVVVVYKSPEDSSAPRSEPVYETPLYEPIQQYVPMPPSTTRPTALPAVITDGYILPDDCKEMRRDGYILPDDCKVMRRNPLPADIAFGTLKKSDLYGS